MNSTLNIRAKLETFPLHRYRYGWSSVLDVRSSSVYSNLLYIHSNNQDQLHNVIQFALQCKPMHWTEQKFAKLLNKVNYSLSKHSGFGQICRWCLIWQLWMPGMGSAWWTILKSVLRFYFWLMSFVQGFIYCSFLEFVCVNYLGRWLHLIFSCICCIFCPSSNLTNLSSSTTRRWVQDPANSKKKENAILDVSDTGWLFSACLVWKHFCMFLFWIFDSQKISWLFTCYALCVSYVPL